MTGATGQRASSADAPAVVRVGRADSNDISLPDELTVSRHHAELRRQPDGGYELVDLGSRNGTFVNHEPIKRRLLQEQDVISIGGRIFRFEAGSLVPELASEEPSFEAVALTVDLPSGQRLLDEVSFHLEPSTLLAVVGPSGSGKTTLLNALTGFRPADTGTVFYGGHDFYRAYDTLRFQLGYVPQENILHDQLTVRQALEFGAELRFSADVERATRNQRVTEVIEQLELLQRAGTRISNLSGGQRKRVNVALELLTEPSLLFLDEPTSGLDPGGERETMELLRLLAADGRIVIVVTHSSQSLDLCDRVLFLAPGGRLAYFGAPKDALPFFGEKGSEGAYARVFRALVRQADVDWKERFRASPDYTANVGGTMESQQLRQREARDPLPPPSRHSFVGELRLLARRQLALVLSEPRTVLMLLLQAPLLGLLYFTVFGPGTLSTRHGDAATLIVWLLAVGATWLGVSNSIREIVKERAVYRRERSVGLSIGPYLASKALFFGVLTAVQAVVLVVITLSRQGLPPADRAGVVPILGRYVLGSYGSGAALGSQWFELFISLALTGIAAVALGLFLSTLVRTSTQALTVLPLVLAVQIVLSLPLIQSSFARDLSHLTSARWGTDAVAESVSLNILRVPVDLALVQGSHDVRYAVDVLNHKEPTYVPAQSSEVDRVLRGQTRWNHLPATWWTSIALMVALTVAPLAGAWLTLRRRDLRVLAERARSPLRGRELDERPPNVSSSMTAAVAMMPGEGRIGLKPSPSLSTRKMSNVVLEIIEGPDAGKQVDLTGPLDIGRDPSCGISLADELVSRHHARVEPRNGSAVVEDLGSMNGTFLNGLQLHAETPFNPGDHLLLGVTVIELRTLDDVHHRPTITRRRPPAFAVAERKPDYVPGGIAAPEIEVRPAQIDALLDVRTKRQARMAPLGIALLVAMAIILYLALR